MKWNEKNEAHKKSRQNFLYSFCYIHKNYKPVVVSNVIRLIKGLLMIYINSLWMNEWISQIGSYLSFSINIYLT